MRVCLTAIVVLALWVPGAVGQGIPNGPPPTSVQMLSKMAGCWRLETATFATIDEMWMAPVGNMMLGASRTVGRGRVVEYEFMRIQFDAPGVIFFAKLPDQPETAFRLTKVDATTAIFENAGHDFPQRVIYTVDREMLIGRIEGLQGGKPRSVDYPMRRVPCP